MSSPEAAVGLVLCDDLMFSSRITGVAQDLHLAMKAARTPAQLETLARAEQPAGVLIDLSTRGLNIQELLDHLRTFLTPLPRIVAFGSHVDTATLRAARDAGCDLVLPRSKFVEDLPRALGTWMKTEGKS